MDLLSSIRKSGSRGGVNFSWDDVSTSQHRENYLGHSLMAPVGRWQKGKDLNWYAKADDDASSNETAEEKRVRERKEEIKRIKEAEEDALARALGLPVAQRNGEGTGANNIDVGEMRRVIKETEDGDDEINEVGNSKGFGDFVGKMDVDTIEQSIEQPEQGGLLRKSDDGERSRKRGIATGREVEKDINTDEGRKIKLKGESAAEVVNEEIADIGAGAQINSGRGRMIGSQGEIMTEDRAGAVLLMREIEGEKGADDSQVLLLTCPYYSSVAPASFFGDETVYAVSTGPGKAGIAIVRISGPSCSKIYTGLCPGKPFPKPRYASVRTLHDPFSPPSVLDTDALVLYFPSPRTVTGEDVLELHIHGGSATVKAVLAAIPRCSSDLPIRYAEPGEFTRRAFQNNRLDLSQVEALSDTLSAETEQQRRAAVRGNSGKLGRTYEEWRQQLLYARGELEALIDFSEDQHFDESPADLMSNVTIDVKAMLKSIAVHEAASHRGELLKKGIRISLLGPPNAGKSSLLNRIVGREASIVSQEAGTTRDIVEVSLDIRGYLCTFADTAGLRTSNQATNLNHISIGSIEQEGIRRAKAKAKESDVVIALASVEAVDGKWTISYDEETLSIAASAARAIIIINKCDVVSLDAMQLLVKKFEKTITSKFSSDVPIVSISCKESDHANMLPLSKESSGIPDLGHIDEFLTTLTKTFESMTSLPTDLEDLLGVTERQRQLLSSCSQHLHLFMEEAQTGNDIVIAAEHLRNAANCLSRITGRGDAGDVEEILGVVFEKFCVGK
ncbi:GTP-binding protein [Phlyctema vagabunda]|uniref:GTP-binding protein n=1 Tax=Phlyctema vagabunda TaxID=108571 RepID=A0ABR4PRF7_9HELO